MKITDLAQLRVAKYSIAVVVFLSSLMVSYSQPSCKELSLGQFFEKLKTLEPVKEKSLKYKKYQGFDFATFTPVENITDSTVITIGYDSKGEIREIISMNINNSESRTSLLVYDFKDYRILLLRIEDIPGIFKYTPTAIFNSKKAGDNYMINVKAQFKNNYESFTLFDKFPVGKFEDISCLMWLDKELYPYTMIKFSNYRSYSIQALSTSSRKPMI